MAQPFALENLASKVGLSQKRATQDYYDAKANEATDLLEKEIDAMQKKASKKTGFVDKMFGDFGGAVKTGVTMLNPVLGLLVGGLDTITSQQDLKEMIKNAGRGINIPARFKGTFLEDYLTGGMMQGQAGLKQNLKGRKQADLITNLLSMIPTAVSAAKGLGPLQKLDAVKSQNMTSNILEAGTKTGEMADDIMVGAPRAKFGNSILDVVESAKSDYDITDILKTAEKTNLGNIVSKINKIALPYTGGALNVKNLTTPLVKGGKMATALSTPGMYAPILQNLLQDYLMGSPEEPVMTRAQAPKFY
tara:strand:- start:2491 stop:3405 length:915 start_codon:yes stop_codon:yes gene_type:complete